MNAGFLVNGNNIRSGISEILNVAVGIFDHEVNVQRQFGHFAQMFHHYRADRDIGYKMTVHDVHVDPIRAAFFRCFNVAFQVRKIGR